MRLDQELVRRGLCESRQEAKECIERGFVFLDDILLTKKTRQVIDSSKITVTQTRKFVSRGGDKLEGVILSIYPGASEVLFANKTALDIGSSTGGFTDCLLRYGVQQVVAVDVGTSQLHPSLLINPKVQLFETTDIRTFVTAIAYDIVVADVSFIALEKILDRIFSFGHVGTDYFLLIKPQFEVGFGNTKKGIVKDATLVDEVLKKYTILLEEKFSTTITILPCTIKGGDGNQEYFIHCKQK